MRPRFLLTRLSNYSVGKMKFEISKRKEFVVPKTHRRQKLIRVAIEVSVIVSVFVGTILSLVRFSNFSFEEATEKFLNTISLREPTYKTVKETTFGGKIEQLINGKVLNVVSIEETKEGNFEIKSKEGVIVVIAENKDLEFQARTLQTLLAKAKIEKRQVALVDFRFDKLVVRYKR